MGSWNGREYLTKFRGTVLGSVAGVTNDLPLFCRGICASAVFEKLGHRGPGVTVVAVFFGTCG